MTPKGKASPAQELLIHLEALARQLEIEVRYEAVPGAGGLARYQGRQCFIINCFLSASEKTDILVQAFRKMDLGSMFLKPAIRKAIYGEE